MEQQRGAVEEELARQLRRIWARHVVHGALDLDSDRSIDGAAKVLLLALADDPDLRASDLAARVGLSRPVVSRRTAALIEGGLLACRPHPDDGRASLLSLTADGGRAVRTLRSDSTESTRRITEGFAEHELTTLVRLLSRLNDEADERLAAPAMAGSER